jgi:ABC-type phosphate transport system substrate-binding protein
MGLTSRLLAGCAALALIAGAAGPALADPPSGVTPRAGDVAGVGSDAIQYLLDQLSRDYDKVHPKAPSLLYSWDAANPGTGRPGGHIVTKAACTAITRPDGPSAAIAALRAGASDPSGPRDFCIDYAGSSRGPLADDPRCAAGGICFIPLAGDAVTWAARDAASGGTDAPASLTLTQLRDIYLCKITNWAAVGGRKAPIKAFLPRTSSGTRQSWLTALGGGTTPIKPGACVSNVGNTLPDNQGVSSVLDSAETIIPYSAAVYIGQAYHDARCARSSCTGSPACTPTAAQNQFGCDEHGVLGLREIGGSKPILPWPGPRGPCRQCQINPKFAPSFQRIVYIVVRDAATADHIPAYLEPFFAARSAKIQGWTCSSPVAGNDITAYGFLALSGGQDARNQIGLTTECGTPHH